MKKQRMMLLGVLVMAGAVIAVVGCGKKSDTEPGESLAERAGTAWDSASERTMEVGAEVADRTADAARTAAAAAKDATGAAVEKTGEVLEGAGAAVESAGAGMRDEEQDETAEE